VCIHTHSHKVRHTDTQTHRHTDTHTHAHQQHAHTPAKTSRELSTLDLGGNDIGPEGAAALGSALGGHPVLKSVELGYNPLGPEGAETIANTFKFNTKVNSCCGLVA
jgi:hypothetical protein